MLKIISLKQLFPALSLLLGMKKTLAKHLPAYLAVAVGLLGIGLGHSTAFANSQLQFQPSSAWHLNYAPESCMLDRQFHDDAGEVLLLRLQGFAPNGRLDVTIAGQPVADSRPVESVDFTIAPFKKVNHDPQSFVGQLIVDGSSVPAITATSVILSDSKASGFGPAPPLSPEELKRLSSLVFNVRGLGKSFDFATGALAPALSAMDSCLANLVKTWGLDPEAQARMATPVPANYPGDWVTTNDYPRDARRERTIGAVHFRLMIDAGGQPTQCVVQDAVPLPLLARWTCVLMMKRAKFRPLDIKNGAPSSTYIASIIHWNLPP